MQCIQSYGNSSSGSDSESDNGESTAHLRPIDSSNSVAKTLTVMAAPDVVPLVIFRLHFTFRKIFYCFIANITSIQSILG